MNECSVVSYILFTRLYDIKVHDSYFINGISVNCQRQGRVVICRSRNCIMSVEL